MKKKIYYISMMRRAKEWKNTKRKREGVVEGDVVGEKINNIPPKFIYLSCI
jgi:hypothetical protein